MRIWAVMANGQSMAKASLAHEGPALACTWSSDGSKVISGGADKTIRVMDVNTGQSMTLTGHEQPVRRLAWMNTPNAQALISGSWDKTIRYWDLRSPQPLAVLQMPERVYAMDANQDLLVVGTAERHICIVNLQNPTAIFRQIASPLKWQTRSVACYHNASGFAVGSIEGRVGLQWIDEKQQHLNFAFKCHRDGNTAYSVNSIAVHPTWGTFSTAGSDGYIHFWDKDSKQRLDSTTSLGSPVTASRFNRTGSLFAYTLSYDWSKGHEHYPSNARNAVMIHQCTDNEIKSRGTPASSSSASSSTTSANVFRRR